MNANERYVVDDKGVAVTLPMEEYEKLQEDLHDLAAVAERGTERTLNIGKMKSRFL